MLESYCREVDRLRRAGREWELTDEQIDSIIEESFKFLEEDGRPRASGRVFRRRKFKRAIIVCLTAVCFYLCYDYRQVAHNYVERNIQEIIYPGMKLVRKLMLPVIHAFPSLTEWYDEACLVGNPYFQVSDIDCWPCHSVRNILNLTTSNLSDHQAGIPFIFWDGKMGKVTFEDLTRMYKGKMLMFDKDAPRLEDSTGRLKTVKQLFLEEPIDKNPSEDMDSHITWKLNRLEATRSVRSMFGILRQPSFVSAATMEKFILIDEPHSPPYHFPATEGTTVFIVQGSGSRLIILNPSPECQELCHRVSIVLHPHHILWYNWWYWRGVSVPLSESNELSITYMGSYY